jgi:hypothetical protein
VLTSSSAPQDVQQAYAMHANCYSHQASASSTSSSTGCSGVIEFWTEQAYLPSRH